ncbi:hypothetical protein Dimus_033862 [Dionaea muscipula]
MRGKGIARATDRTSASIGRGRGRGKGTKATGTSLLAPSPPPAAPSPPPAAPSPPPTAPSPPPTAPSPPPAAPFPPPTAPSPPPATPSSPLEAPSSNEGSDVRVFIYLDEGNQLVRAPGYTSSVACPVRMITKIFTSMFDKPYKSWATTPITVRDMWFKEYKKYFRWNPLLEGPIRQAFEVKGAERMKDILKKERTKGRAQGGAPNKYGSNSILIGDLRSMLHYPRQTEQIETLMLEVTALHFILEVQSQLLLTRGN